MASSQTRDFANPATTTILDQNYAQNPPPNNSSSANPSATGPTGSINSDDPVTASYGNTHSSTNHANPIHPSDPQSTSHPAYGNSKSSSPYETRGGNPGQGGGEGGQVGNTSGKTGGLNDREYHRNVDAEYGHATGPTAPEGWMGEKRGQAGPYDTAGGNSAQPNPTQNDPHMAGLQSPVPISDTTSTTPATSTTTTTKDSDRSTGSKVKEMAHGVKGLFAAVHGAGESARGSFNAGVDKTFNEVLNPHPIPFPSLRPLRDFAEDGDGEFPPEVYASSRSGSQVSTPGFGRVDDVGGKKGRYPGRSLRVKVKAG